MNPKSFDFILAMADIRYHTKECRNQRMDAKQPPNRPNQRTNKQTHKRVKIETNRQMRKNGRNVLQ